MWNVRIVSAVARRLDDLARFAGRWYEARREHLGIEFFDAVDATIDQIQILSASFRLKPEATQWVSPHRQKNARA